jgi:hypothetical protein
MDVVLDAAVAAASPEVMKYVWTAGGNERNQSGGIGSESSEEIMEAASAVFVAAIN